MVIYKDHNACLNCGVHENTYLCRCNKLYVINPRTFDLPHFKALKRLGRKTSDKINRGLNTVCEILRPTPPICSRCSGVYQNINNSDCFISKRFSDDYVAKVNAQTIQTSLEKSLEETPHCNQVNYMGDIDKCSPRQTPRKKSSFWRKLCGFKKDSRSNELVSRKVQTVNYCKRRINVHFSDTTLGTYNSCDCCACTKKFGYKSNGWFAKTEASNGFGCNPHYIPYEFWKNRNVQEGHDNKLVFISPVSGRKYNFDPPCRDEAELSSDSFAINRKRIDETLQDPNVNSKLPSLSPRLSRLLTKYSVDELEMAVNYLYDEGGLKKSIPAKKIESHDINLERARKLSEKIKRERCSCENSNELSISVESDDTCSTINESCKS